MDDFWPFFHSIALPFSPKIADFKGFNFFDIFDYIPLQQPGKGIRMDNPALSKLLRFGDGLDMFNRLKFHGKTKNYKSKRRFF